MYSIYNNTKLNSHVIIELSSRIGFNDHPEHLINHFPTSGVRLHATFDPRKRLWESAAVRPTPLTDYFCETAAASVSRVLLAVISGNAGIGHLSHLWVDKHGARAAGSSCVSHLHTFTACICFSFMTFLCPGLRIFPVINRNKQILQCVCVCVCVRTYTHIQIRLSGNRLCGCSLSCTVIFLPKIFILFYSYYVFIFLF